MKESARKTGRHRFTVGGKTLIDRNDYYLDAVITQLSVPEAQLLTVAAC
jgi:hypothetical protein